MGGYNKAKETADKLRAEQEVSVQAAEVNTLAVKEQLALLQSNSALAALYNENAKVGAENLAGTVPYLKVHAAGRSSTNFLANGEKPNDGWFFYKPTQEQFKTVTVHILTISAGFRAEGLNEEDGKKKMVYNQVLGGVLRDGIDYKPFIMFLTGLKLKNMWEFGKEANKYTTAKPVRIPMFALTIELSTEEIKHDRGFSWIINFKLLKDETGFPMIVTDEGEFVFLRDMVDTIRETMQGLINAKTAGEDVEEHPTPLNVPGDINAITGPSDEELYETDVHGARFEGH